MHAEHRTSPFDAAVARLSATPGAADARDHGVDALLRDHALDALPPGDPRRDALRDRALREAALEARRNARVAAALGALAAAGVPALVFKGSALAHSHYPRPELRTRDDTDLLVDPAHAGVAGRVLTALGLLAVPAVDGARVMRQRLHRARDDDALLHNIDLHWAVVNSARAGAFAPRRLLARARALPALGPHALAPADDDALLLACLHLDAHHAGAVRLVWLLDVHLLACSLGAHGRERVAGCAQRAGVAPACAWVLGAAHEAFSTPLDGFDALLRDHRRDAPSALRAAQWLRELRALPDVASRTAWLAQHAFPSPAYMRSRAAPGTSLALLYLRRALRAAAHLARR